MFPRVLFPLVSHCFPSCFPLLDGVSAFLFPFVGWCVRFPEPLAPFLVPFVGWCVPEVLSPLFSQLLSLLNSLCWMVFRPSQGLVSLVSKLVSQLVFFLVSLCWMVCPPSRGLVFLLPTCPPTCLPACLACLRACAKSVLDSLCWMVCLSPFLFPFVGYVSAFPKPCFLCPQACLPVCLPFFPFVGWCVRLPEALSPLFPSLSPSLSSSLFPFVFRYLVLRQS